MAFGFASVQHWAATAFSDLHKVLTFVEKQAPKVLATESVVEGVTAVVLGPASPAITIERAAFSALGTIIVATHAADDATAAKGVNIVLGAAAVAAYKSLVVQFKDELKVLGYSF